MRETIFSLLFCFILAYIYACTGERGPQGPPGILDRGSVEGVVTVWEDYDLSSMNSSVAPSGVTIALEGTEFYGITDGEGRYTIEDVPAGVYVIVAFKDSSKSAEEGGYGTSKQYNFVVGGGTSYYSPDIGKKAWIPKDVKAEAETVEVDGQDVVGIMVSWKPGNPELSHVYWVWRSPLKDLSTRELVTRTLRDSVFNYNISPGSYYYGVQADNDIRYFDEEKGEYVFPTQSPMSAPSNQIIITASGNG